MNNNVKALIAGISATAIMTGFMLLAPFVGLPKMDVGKLLGTFLGGSEIAGWIAHFAIGVIFAFIYIGLFNKWLPVENKIARGLIFGILVFVVSEIILTAINVLGYLNWTDRENMARMVFGNALACMIYGAVLGTFFARVGTDPLEDSKRPAADYQSR